MPPTITFIRHAESCHNNAVGHGVSDPYLTPDGVQQCVDLSRDISVLGEIDLIVASPLKRAIQTALMLRAYGHGPPSRSIMVLPELQELSDRPCDTPSPVHELQTELASLNVELSHLDSSSHTKRDLWIPTPSASEIRCRVVREWLHCRPEGNIAVVTHGGVLHFLTGDWVGAGTGCGWEHVEWRSYQFSDDGDSNHSLVEMEESRKRRGMLGPSPSRAEQLVLKNEAEKNWRQALMKQDYPIHPEWLAAS